MKKHNENIFFRLIAISAFILISTSILIILQDGESIGYDISIYSVFPIYFWILLVISLFLGQILLTKNIFFEKKSDISTLLVTRANNTTNGHLYYDYSSYFEGLF